MVGAAGWRRSTAYRPECLVASALYHRAALPKLANSQVSATVAVVDGAIAGGARLASVHRLQRHQAAGLLAYRLSGAATGTRVRRADRLDPALAVALTAGPRLVMEPRYSVEQRKTQDSR